MTKLKRKWPQFDEAVTTTMAARVAIARKSAGLSQNRLAKLVKCSAASINQIESGQIKELKAALLFRISDVLEVSARWLIWGTGPIHKWAVLTLEEDALIHAFRALPEPIKAQAASILNGLLAASSGAPQVPQHPQRSSPPPTRKNA